MKIVIVGARGFIGSALAEALGGRGHQVVGCGRGGSSGAAIGHWISCDLERDRIRDWLPRLQGVDLVINAAGIFQQSGPGGFRRVQDQGPRRLFAACARMHTPVIQISALGAEAERPPTPFLASKQRADRYLLRLGIPALVVYPGLVAGEGGRSFALFSALAALPVIPLPTPTDSPQPCVHIRRLCREVAAKAENMPDGPETLVLAEPVPFNTLMLQIRNWLGKPPTRVLPIPTPWLHRLFRLFPRLQLGLLSRDSLRMLQTSTQTQGQGPASLATDLQAAPPSPAYRRGAALHFLPAAGLASLVVLWLWTAIASVADPALSIRLAREFGISNHGLGLAVTYGGAALDALLGLGLLFKPYRALVLRAQIAVILAYSLLIALFMPAYWMHPFGPLTKNLPLLVLTLGLYLYYGDTRPGAK